MNEQFSAFLDGEATRDESDAVATALLRDERLRDSWSRQHWLRTTLRARRGEVAVALDTGFSRRVMYAMEIQSAEADGAPQTQPSMPAVRRNAPASRRRRWRGMAGFAVAASAAGVVFLVSGTLPDDTSSERGAKTPTIAASTAPTEVRSSQDVANTPGGAVDMLASNDLIGGVTQQASNSASSVSADQQGPADHWSVSDPALADELNSYLVEHNGLARGYGLSGTTPAFVRVATYGQEPTQ